MLMLKNCWLLVFSEMLVTASGDVVSNFYVEKLLVVFGSSVDIFSLFGDVDVANNFDVRKLLVVFGSTVAERK